MQKKYDVVVGLEIHVELKTNTKVFCSCKNEYNTVPNTSCCPVCIGFPGTLPVINKEAVKKTIMAGIVLDSKINDIAIFERKNYFYPDLSKSYQISQLEKPICIGGGIKLNSDKFIRLNRIHLEEDAGKLIHDRGCSKIDYNRGGVPLIEIVTEPDFSSSDEVVEFVNNLRERLIFSKIADCKMEFGGLRCDINLSVKSFGSSVLGNRTEIKNMNSLKMITAAIDYESNRQINLVERGEKIEIQTIRWDDERQETVVMRSKEHENEYRYFEDPDIFCIKLPVALVEEIKKSMPQNIIDLKEKWKNEYELPKQNIDILLQNSSVVDYFEKCVSLYNKPKQISNWIVFDLLKLLKDDVFESILPECFIEIIKFVEDGHINKIVAIELLNETIETKLNPKDIAKNKGLFDKSNTDDIKNIVLELANNARVKKDYLDNPNKVVQFIIGNVMKKTAGKAKLDDIKNVIKEILD